MKNKHAMQKMKIHICTRYIAELSSNEIFNVNYFYCENFLIYGMYSRNQNLVVGCSYLAWSYSGTPLKVGQP